MILATVIDLADLGSTVVAALIAGVGVTGAFSVAIFGAARMADARVAERPLAAIGAGALMLFGLLATLGGIALGIGVMIEG